MELLASAWALYGSGASLIDLGANTMSSRWCLTLKPELCLCLGRLGLRFPRFGGSPGSAWAIALRETRCSVLDELVLILC